MKKGGKKVAAKVAANKKETPTGSVFIRQGKKDYK